MDMHLRLMSREGTKKIGVHKMRAVNLVLVFTRPGV